MSARRSCRVGGWVFPTGQARVEERGRRLFASVACRLRARRSSSSSSLSTRGPPLGPPVTLRWVVCGFCMSVKHDNSKKASSYQHRGRARKKSWGHIHLGRPSLPPRYQAPHPANFRAHGLARTTTHSHTSRVPRGTCLGLVPLQYGGRRGHNEDLCDE